MDSAHLNDSASRAAQASRFYPGLLASFGFIILYFALQALCTGLIMAYTHGVSGAAVSGQPLTIIWGLVASSIVQLGLMWLYLRRSGRITSVGLNDLAECGARTQRALQCYSSSRRWYSILCTRPI